jgi:glycosyltransferase involved in cell wall biosynthesis
MNIYIDNIIFSLQRLGGASVVWQQYLERILKDKDFNCQLLEYDNAERNFFRKQLTINKDLIDIKSSQFLNFKRYFDLNSNNDDKHIFHSSHYRVEKGNNVINVTTVHDFTYENFIRGLAQKVHTWQKNKAINNSKGIICVSDSTKKDLLHFLPHINENKIRVIYNGVDKAFKRLNEKFVLDKDYPFEDYNYALYVGDRRASYKNFSMAVTACALAKTPLLIIGGGELTAKEIYDLKLKLGESNFKSLLNLSVEDLNFYYNRAFCLLYPSNYEGFGIPVIEAQVAGCPVIATNSSSIPEVIGNSYLAIDNPSPFKIADKMKDLRIGNLRTETIEFGFEKSKRFSWQNTYNETKNFYNELYFEK